MRGGRAALILALVAVAGLAVAALRFARRGQATHAAPGAASSLAMLDVEICGCDEITRAPACATSAGSELHLWLPRSGGARIAIAFDGHDAESKVTSWPDGETRHVLVPKGATRLSVRADRDAGSAAWSIPLVPARVVPPSVDKAKALRNEGRLDEAATLLTAAVASPDPGRSSALALLARVDYARGRIDAAVAHFRESIALLESEGRASAAADDTFALVFLLLERGRFGEVRPLLAAASERARDWPEGRALVISDQGILAWDTGDLRTALRLTRETERHASRLGAARLRRMAAQTAARELLDAGRNAEALQGLRALLDSDGDAMSACDRADLLNNIGWAALLAASEPPSPGDYDPRDALAPALAIFRDTCPDPNRIANSLENVALAELSRGRLAQASTALEAAKEAEHDPGVPIVLFWLHLDGRIALAAHDARRALASFTREAEAAAALGTTEDQRTAAEDRAEALLALGRTGDALATLEAADALVDASGAFVPLGEGKASFFGTRVRAAMLRVQLLVDLHRDADAMDVARRARARVVDGIGLANALGNLDAEARGRWEDLAGRYRTVRQAIDGDAAHDWELSSERLASALEHRRESAVAARALLDEAFAVLSMPRRRDAVGQSPRPLRPDELELAYFPTRAGWIGFAYGPNGVHARALGKLDPAAPADALGRAMLGPFDEAIAHASRVRLSLYGAIRAVDVHALLWRGRPLLDHAIVEYALEIGGASAVTLEAAPRRALLVADPTGDLPAARDEADVVATASRAPAAGR